MKFNTIKLKISNNSIKAKIKQIRISIQKIIHENSFEEKLKEINAEDFLTENLPEYHHDLFNKDIDDDDDYDDDDGDDYTEEEQTKDE